jgi:hypothetical protein
MASSTRIDVYRANYLGRLARSWEKCKDLTFGEMIAAALDDRALGLMSDVEIAEAVERFALLEHKGPPDPEGSSGSGSIP